MYQSATLLMTLDDSEGHSSLEGHHLEQRSSVVWDRDWRLYLCRGL